MRGSSRCHTVCAEVAAIQTLAHSRGLRRKASSDHGTARHDALALYVDQDAGAEGALDVVGDAQASLDLLAFDRRDLAQLGRPGVAWRGDLRTGLAWSLALAGLANEISPGAFHAQMRVVWQIARQGLQEIGRADTALRGIACRLGVRDRLHSARAKGLVGHRDGRNRIDHAESWCESRARGGKRR